MSKSKQATYALKTSEDNVERQRLRHIRHEKKEHNFVDEMDEDTARYFTSSMMSHLTDD